MNVRRSAAVLAATAVIATAAPAVAASPSPSPSVVIPEGLYGAGDPTYDGVWRQSLALIAQDRVKVKPATEAISWLAGQQCANGAFAAFRADPAKACDSKVMVDTNSTAVAVQALSAFGGHEDEIGKASTWLQSMQNKDGGWGYTPGGASDANSTAVVIGALSEAGQDVAAVVHEGRSPFDALRELALPCAESGAFAYQPDKKGKLAANADATAAAVVALRGTSMLRAKVDTWPEAACADAPHLTEEQAAANGASYLAQAVQKDGYLKSVLPGAEDQPDYGNTADTVVALAVQRGEKAARKPLTWLEKNSATWAEQSGPAAYAQLIIAADVAGGDPRDFGGTDLVEQLNATGPAPQKAAAEKPSEDSGDGSGNAVWWTVAAGLAAGVGIGFLFSGRKKKRQP
ncbi:terpene cyclase/mutase family protein [Streptomyces sp. S3(2020)]|uniref:prenyltransferase/squalene oxidase repeat-containing protein n=1 Tax=Streptomyces sp. S3(2020) TaxID=2732044 RepID=UPI001487BFF3|nr:prenyltransferase/squalene oxidase repeat-containing protein [Streptomyces sp. S3(2020)]NNN36514.1 terpene cyclase/mutase family protein [Streptomyces sp. S3(2020)]